MNLATTLLLIAAGCAAVVNWWSVWTPRKNVEYIAKPTTTALLICAAVTIDAVDSTQQFWFVVALGFSLGGDVALMLPSDRFVAGLTSFLFAHIAYSIGMVARGVEGIGLAIGGAVAIVVVLTIGRRIASAAPRPLRQPVGAYILVISGMVALAIGTVEPWIIVGALLFYASDALIGWTRFIGNFPRSRVAIMATYHLGQAGLVLGLL